MDEEELKRALLDVAQAILGEAGVEIDVGKGMVTWEDPAIRPYAPQPITPDKLMMLGRVVLAAKRCWEKA